MSNKIKDKIKIGVLVENRGKLLLLRELNDVNGKYYWNIIKGTFEPKKDRNFIKSAERECKEEAKISVKINHLQSIMHLHKKNTTQFNFLASIQNGTPAIPKLSEQRKRKENIVEVRFFNKKELRKIKKHEFMNERAFFAVKNWLRGINHNPGIFFFK